MQADLHDRIQLDLDLYAKLGLLSTNANDLIPKWQSMVHVQPKRFIDDNHAVDWNALQNFRNLQLFISDSPAWDINKTNPINILSAGRRGGKKMLQECLEVLKEQGYGELLKKYPCPAVGNPHVYRYQGFTYTFRWFKHIYFIGLMNRILGNRLTDNFIALDIGSSYGIFSSLVKKEYSSSHHVLVDFPEQLILAHYFLSTYLPEARVAGIQEISSQESLSRDFIEAYDFLLIPCSYYQRLSPESVDLVTNFASLGEMSRKWFDDYLNSPAFLTAKYLFTANRVQSYPTYDTDLTILDYPIWDKDKKFHFGICPAWSGYNHYPLRNMFFFEKESYPPYFEYIGEI